MTGPWTASVEAKPSGGHWYVVLDDEENGLGEFYGDDHEANVANVHVAAAAPDLRRELRDLVDWLVANQRNIEGEFLMDELLAGPRAALGKACAEQVRA